jgi:hypothetical protein
MSLSFSGSSTGSSAGAQTITPGIPAGQTVNPLNPFNYYNYNFTASGENGELGSYEDFSQKLIIKRGDEVRIIYNSASGSITPTYQIQDFTVTSVPSSSGYVNTLASGMAAIFGPLGNLPGCTLDKSRIFETIMVDPNPEDFNIPDGKVYSCTIRRREQADDRIIIYQNPPSGSDGAKTKTLGGYLIPSDFTDIQKRNTQTLINQLKGKNAFKPDVDSESQ